MTTMRTPDAGELLGLILAGGRSSRMRQDKAALLYAGQTQVARINRLLAPFCASVFLSNRVEQKDWPGHAGLPQIHDRQENLGPAGGIIAAQAAWPRHPWLVVACDLPFLDEPTLRQLLARRDPAQLVTAFASAHDGKPEPLCAIYEPASRPILEGFLAQGLKCPRKMLIQMNLPLLKLKNPRALDNVNHPEEYREASACLAKE